MKKGIMLVSAIMLAGVACAQTPEELQAELQTIDKQIDAARQRIMESPEYQRLQESRQKAEEAFEQALSAVPEAQAIDSQLKPLMDQRTSLEQKRKEFATQGKIAEAKQLKEQMEQLTAQIRSLLKQRGEVETLYSQTIGPKKKLLHDARQAEQAVMDDDEEVKTLCWRRGDALLKIHEHNGKTSAPESH